MNILERITKLIHHARMDGGWDDEAVASKILDVLCLDENGEFLTDLKRADEVMAPTEEG